MTRIRGLSVCKCYLFHQGHELLFNYALEHCDELTILVGHNPAYAISAEERASWVKEIVPGANVLVVNELPDSEDSEKWAWRTIQLLGYSPDLVFTSEDYGEPYAKFMGSKHIMVDRFREAVPISGREIRADVRKHFKYLTSPVKAKYTLRVAVVGAESTGKSTLAQKLAIKYETVWVPEYGRLYAEGKIPSLDVFPNKKWTTNEFVHIASHQGQLEDMIARDSNKVIFCDTTPDSTELWHERYMGWRDMRVHAAASARHYDLYVLAGDEIPFFQDGTRDGEQIRHEMHNKFIEELKGYGIPYIIASGSVVERIAQVSRYVDPMLAMPLTI